jgi:hypothetical protein
MVRAAYSASIPLMGIRPWLPLCYFCIGYERGDPDHFNRGYSEFATVIGGSSCPADGFQKLRGNGGQGNEELATRDLTGEIVKEGQGEGRVKIMRPPQLSSSPNRPSKHSPAPHSLALPPPSSSRTVRCLPPHGPVSRRLRPLTPFLQVCLLRCWLWRSCDWSSSPLSTFLL